MAASVRDAAVGDTLVTDHLVVLRVTPLFPFARYLSQRSVVRPPLPHIITSTAHSIANSSSHHTCMDRMPYNKLVVHSYRTMAALPQCRFLFTMSMDAVSCPRSLVSSRIGRQADDLVARLTHQWRRRWVPLHVKEIVTMI